GLIIAMMLGGVANATAQPAANLAISRTVESRRLGLAFGVKQSAAPAASLIAGLAVPSIALATSWRWAFVASAAAAAGLAISAILSEVEFQAAQPKQESKVAHRTPPLGLALVTLGAGLGIASANSLGVFFVESAVHFDIPLGTA